MTGAKELAQAVELAVQRCRRTGMSRQDAEDCVHDALLTLLSRQAEDPEAQPVTAPQAWLTVTAKHRFVDLLRRAQREQRALSRMHTPAGPEPGEAVADQALAVWLAGELRQLPDTTRQVCQALAGGATVADTADRLGLTQRSVQSHVTRARRLLRAIAACAVAALVGTALRLVRPAAAAATPAILTAVTVGVSLLPHHTVLPHHNALPEDTARRAPAVALYTPTSADQPRDILTAVAQDHATPHRGAVHRVMRGGTAPDTHLPTTAVVPASDTVSVTHSTPTRIPQVVSVPHAPKGAARSPSSARRDLQATRPAQSLNISARIPRPEPPAARNRDIPRDHRIAFDSPGNRPVWPGAATPGKMPAANR